MASTDNQQLANQEPVSGRARHPANGFQNICPKTRPTLHIQYILLNTQPIMLLGEITVTTLPAIKKTAWRIFHNDTTRLTGILTLAVGLASIPGIAQAADALAGAQPAAQAAAKHPNVLLIIADDLRDRVGCYGNPYLKTPNIDSLAAKGLRFDHAYVQYSVCDPSRSSFLTGLRPEQTRVWDNQTCFRDNLPQVVTLPQCFRENGYFTAGYGKVFHTTGHDFATWADAKNSWNDCREAPQNGDIRDAINHGQPGRTVLHDGDFSREPAIVAGRNLTHGVLKWCYWGETAGPDDLEPDYQTATAAIAAMDKAGDKPWFIAAGLHRPHDPFICPKKYFDLYPLASLKLYHDPADMSKTLPLAIPSGLDYESFQKFSDEDKLEFMRAYYACTTFMDAQVGRLLQALDQRNQWTNTIVIFMGDNGYHLGERKWWNKVTLFERCCRIPFIMAGANVSAGEVCEAPTEMVDLYPTLLDLCHVNPPPNQTLAGQTFRPLLANPEGPGKGYAFTMVTRDQKHLVGRSVRTSRWRLTEWDGGKAGIELYDEANDPEENHNLAENPKYSELVASLRAMFGRLPPIAAEPKTFLKRDR